MEGKENKPGILSCLIKGKLFDNIIRQILYHEQNKVNLIQIFCHWK